MRMRRRGGAEKATGRLKKKEVGVRLLGDRAPKVGPGGCRARWVWRKGGSSDQTRRVGWPWVI